MANLQAAPLATNQQRTTHTPIIAAVPDFAKEDPRPRWWCSQPTCFASTTAARDLNRHYRLHHPALIVNNQVLAEEKRSWIHAKYLDTGFATDVEVAAEAAAVGMAQAALAVVEVEVEEDEVHEEPIRVSLYLLLPFQCSQSRRLEAAMMCSGVHHSSPYLYDLLATRSLWSTPLTSIFLYPSHNHLLLTFLPSQKKSKANMKPSTDQPPSLHTPTIPHSEDPSRCRRPGAAEWRRE